MRNKRLFFLFSLIAIALTGCAKRGTIMGGAKDTIPPVIVRSLPENMTTGFTGNEIRIDFSEYIRIKDLNKQLIVSPPMNTAPDVTPNGVASKYINIKLRDTLKPNTTYSFNFGQSITDNNEGNPYSQFKFVFSTGSYIDSLYLNGRIKDAYDRKPDNFVTVMLYEANESYNDSTVYKEKPRYVTNTLDSLTQFSLENLKAGKYYLFALKDGNANYKYDPKLDKIGFLKEPVTVPNDTVFQLELFREMLPVKLLKPVQESSNRLLLPFEGKPKPSDIKVSVRNGQETVQAMVTRFPQKDSLQVWLPRGLKADSLQVAAEYAGKKTDFNVKIKEMKAADSLSVAAVQRGSINFRDTFTLTASTPVTAIDVSRINILRKDSTAVAFTHQYDDMEQKLQLKFEKGENENYAITLFPGALRDFYGKENDTLKYKLATRALTDYGNLRVTVQNVKRFPFILQLTDEKGDIKASYYSEKETQINFDAIEPNKYILRFIYDDNRNGEWDTGNLLEKRQAEEVIYYPAKPNVIDVRANWDVEEQFSPGG